MWEGCVLGMNPLLEICITRFELVVSGVLIIVIALCYLFYQLGRCVKSIYYKERLRAEMCRKCEKELQAITGKDAIEHTHAQRETLVISYCKNYRCCNGGPRSPESMSG